MRSLHHSTGSLPHNSYTTVYRSRVLCLACPHGQGLASSWLPPAPMRKSTDAHRHEKATCIGVRELAYHPDRGSHPRGERRSRVVKHIEHPTILAVLKPCLFAYVTLNDTLAVPCSLST